jgi:histidine triad (HIT) family protein
MSLDGVYDPDNIFAKIVRGEASCHRVFEDADTLAFMDLFPQAPGHALVIHKHATARNLLEVDLADLAPVMATVQKVGRAMVKAFKPDGLAVMQFNGAASGQTIFHLHVHLLPRWAGRPLGLHAQKMADPAELAEQARAIAAAIEA